MQYRVEYEQFDQRTGFHWSGRDFNSLVEALRFYLSVGRADLLKLEKYKGYSFLRRK